MKSKNKTTRCDRKDTVVPEICAFPHATFWRCVRRRLVGSTSHAPCRASLRPPAIGDRTLRNRGAAHAGERPCDHL